MTAMTSRGLSGNSRTARDGVPRVVGGRGWWGGEKREGTAWRPAVDISERRDAYRVTVEIPGINASEVEILVPKAAEPQGTPIPIHVSQVTVLSGGARVEGR